MAQYLMCCVYDAAVKAFNMPMYFRTKEEAIRSFGDACRDPKNTDFAKHSGDFSIWHVGYFDDNGDVAVLERACLIRAIDVVVAAPVT